jgi:hypothetical protein
MNTYEKALEDLYFLKYKVRLNFNEIIEIYEDLVQQCEDGYSYTFFELDNEIYIRDKIDYLLKHSELKKYEEHLAFISQINELDNRLKSVSLFNIRKPNENWWKSFVLKHAYEEYWEFVKVRYGIEIIKLEF